MSEQGASGDSLPQEHDGRAMEAALSPGAQLAAHREAAGWSVEQVAAQLNLAPRQVQAIESDNYPALPGMPITRGFIRAYAKLLKIDAGPLLASLPSDATPIGMQAVASRKTLAAPFSEARIPSMVERRSSSARWFVGAFLLLLASGGVWLWQGGHGLPGGAQQMLAGQGLEQANNAAKMVVEALEQQPDTASPTAEPNRVDSVESANMSQLPEQPQSPQQPSVGQAAADNQPPAIASAAGDTPQAASAPQAPKDELQIAVRDEAWIEIRRVDGNSVVLSRLMKPGESHSVEVSGPLSLVVGNASGVDMTFRGEPLALKGGAGNVARLTLK